MSLLGGKALFRNGHPKDTIVPRKRAPVAQSRVLNRIWGTDQPDRADEFEGQSTKGAALGRESEKADPNRRRRGVSRAVLCECDQWCARRERGAFPEYWPF